MFPLASAGETQTVKVLAFRHIGSNERMHVAMTSDGKSSIWWAGPQAWRAACVKDEHVWVLCSLVYSINNNKDNSIIYPNTESCAQRPLRMSLSQYWQLITLHTLKWNFRNEEDGRGSKLFHFLLVCFFTKISILNVSKDPWEDWSVAHLVKCPGFSPQNPHNKTQSRHDGVH